MKPPRLSLTRREILMAGGMAAGSAALARPVWAASQPLLNLDLRSSIPADVSFHRFGPASYETPGTVAFQPADKPRFWDSGDGQAKGLLIEGAAQNEIPYSSDFSKWWVTSGISVHQAAGILAPDGSQTVFRIDRGKVSQDSRCYWRTADAGPPEIYGTASVWLRSVSGTGKWRLVLRDEKSYSRSIAEIEVGPEWRRYSLSNWWISKDVGGKRFSVLENSADAPGLLDAVYAWGAQYERGLGPTSLIPTTGQVGARPADEVTFSGQVLGTKHGRLRIELPAGGNRSGIVLDFGGASSQQGIAIGYSNSGWITARIGAVELVGVGDVTDDTVIELHWTETGAMVATGSATHGLASRATETGTSINSMGNGLVRLGMAADGSRPLNRPVALVMLDDMAGEIGAARTVSFIPSGYKLTFADEFDDTDVSRINENGTGGKPGAPAWRSRYQNPRFTVINGEKQIYMDPQFAGTSPRPLGVQPFSIADSILKIKADRADPTLVSPFIMGARYTSGCITSANSFAQKYGYFEMRARLPRGKGFWPAFWLLPKAPHWPPEIDIFEATGDQPMHIHIGVLEGKGGAYGGAGNWTDDLADTTDGFHYYGVDWNEQSITFYWDGRNVGQYQNHIVKEEMYILANLALGSKDPNWIPDPDSSTPFPGYFEIDYIRAYGK